jgi:hypothetical protein
MIDCTQPEGTCSLMRHKITQIACLLWLSFLPYCFILANYWMYPGFMVTFLNHPLARIILFLLTLLQTFMILLLVWGQVSQKSSLLSAKNLKHWLFTSIFIIVLSATTIILSIIVAFGPFVIRTVQMEPIYMDLIQHPEHLVQRPELKEMYARTVVDILSKDAPGIWFFQIGGLVLILISVLSCALWFTRAESR